MTANMKLPGWKRRIGASSLRGRLGTNQNGQAAKEKKQNVVAGAGCSENSSGFRLREKCFSLDIPFYRTSGLPTIGKLWRGGSNRQDDYGSSTGSPEFVHVSWPHLSWRSTLTDPAALFRYKSYPIASGPSYAGAAVCRTHSTSRLLT